MKKPLILGVILVSFAGVALAEEPLFKLPPDTDYFSGFYIGGTIGLHQVGFNGSSTVSTPFDLTGGGIVPSADALINSGGANAFNGFTGFQGGFGKVFSHQVYLGVNGFGEWGNQSITNTSTSTIPGAPPRR